MRPEQFSIRSIHSLPLVLGGGLILLLLALLPSCSSQTTFAEVDSSEMVDKQFAFLEDIFGEDSSYFDSSLPIHPIIAGFSDTNFLESLDALLSKDDIQFMLTQGDFYNKPWYLPRLKEIREVTGETYNSSGGFSLSISPGIWFGTPVFSASGKTAVISIHQMGYDEYGSGSSHVFSLIDGSWILVYSNPRGWSYEPYNEIVFNNGCI
ncbi:MAG: hypothetical protein QNK23_11295 [Crocinitomicaceae bacterium]|nr:hypothetical protein [Crocinitomicaceae bacterium]